MRVKGAASQQRLLKKRDHFLKQATPPPKKLLKKQSEKKESGFLPMFLHKVDVLFFFGLLLFFAYQSLP